MCHKMAAAYVRHQQTALFLLPLPALFLHRTFIVSGVEARVKILMVGIGERNVYAHPLSSSYGNDSESLIK